MAFVYPIYDKEKIKEMRDALRKQPDGLRNLVYFEIALETALRNSDILKLTKADVKYGIIKDKSNKKKKFYEFELSEKLMDLIRGYIKYMDDDELLFKMDRTTPYRFLKRAAKEVGIKENIGCHSTRKSKAYHFFNDNDKDVVMTMELLQHSGSLDSTLSYIGTKKEEFKEKLANHKL